MINEEFIYFLISTCIDKVNQLKKKKIKTVGVYIFLEKFFGKKKKNGCDFLATIYFSFLDQIANIQK